MDTVERRTPRYLRIYRELRSQIETGVLERGAQLPAQRELCREYETTLVTLRQALQLLERDGLLVAKSGVGTFVAPQPPRLDLSHLRSFIREMEEQGRRVTTRVVSMRVVRDEFAASRLNLVSDRVFRVERVRYGGDEPLIYQHSFLEPTNGSALRRADLVSTPLYTLLESLLSIEIVRAVETLRPVLLTGREAELLEQPEGAPAFLSERLSYAEAPEPILFDRALLPDRVVITAERVRDDMTMGYRYLGGVGGEPSNVDTSRVEERRRR